ncbi:hypothetical protein PHMEG_00024018 [Phytophthora megakarya]|uniref:HAT C-terminal dimerisation domain-containing protein n=1 Tax=Phytophthora megakarya TaxID=4795 RepID=A0A225VFI8_9STRA|nr:hypothetical protein PHMEG_00024018 [Phytophthora megakarya]
MALDSIPRPRRTPAEVKVAVVARAKEREHDKSKYIDLSWVQATSVEVERLYSSTKCMLGYLRKCMNSETLEPILFLQLNWDLVTNEVITKYVRNAREAGVDGSEEYDNYM